ncbi:MAG: ADOP family duplicated permease [Gemmatimonadota bacterium]
MRAGDGLPPEVDRLIEQVLSHADLEGAGRREVESDLREHFEDGLASGRSVAELIRVFGDAEEAGRRIAAARRRRTPEGRAGRRSGLDWTGELGRAARGLRRARGFSALVLGTLALGIGATTAVFTALDAVLLRPLPYPDAGRLARIYEVGEWSNAPQYLRAPVAERYASWDDVFESVGVVYTYRETGGDLTDGDVAERVVLSYADAGFFRVLGVQPALGRVFVPEESVRSADDVGPGPAAPVAVLSWDLWARRFGSDANAVGSTLQVDGMTIEVIGVMPKGFTNPFGSSPDLWVPQNLTPGGGNSWGNYFLSSVARLAPGVSVEDAHQRVLARFDAWALEEPELGNVRPLVVPLREDLVGGTRRTMLWILAAAVTLLLISTCVNAGNLVFARSLGRVRDLAVRGALGAGRRRLLWHLMLESALLAGAGGLLGVAVGWAGLEAILALAPDALPTLTQPTLSGRVLVLSLFVSTLALLLFGLAPAWHFSTVAPAKALRAGGRSGTESRRHRSLRDGLVVVQMAVALALVVGAGLLVKSFAALRAVDLGIDATGVETFEVHLPRSRYPAGEDRIRFHRAFEDRVRALTGVRSVGATSWLPVSGRYHVWGYATDPADLQNDEVWSSADIRVVTGDYFEAMGVRLLSGSGLAEIDPGGPPVMWINRALAEHTFPGEDPIGRMLFAADEIRRVVGVVGDVAHEPRGAVAPQIFVLHDQFADERNWALIQTVRADGDLADLTERITAELKAVDPDLVLFRAAPFAERLAGARAEDRFALGLMGAFAILALTLSAVGTFGVLAGSVARRRKEIGIRMALGADRAQVRRGVLRSAFSLTGGGVLLGALLAWIGGRWLAVMLFGVQAHDPVVFSGASLLLLGLGALAAWVPAARASGVDPARTLVEE